MKISVIIPVRNEEKNVAEAISRLRRASNGAGDSKFTKLVLDELSGQRVFVDAVKP